jgi:hypothetical protein
MSLLARLVGFGPKRVARAIRSNVASPPYTAAEVKEALGPGSPGEVDPVRAKVILACAGQPSEWLDYLEPPESRLPSSLAARLPTIVFWWHSGLGVVEMGRRLDVFCGDWVAEWMLDTAAARIAARLNDWRRAPVRGHG